MDARDARLMAATGRPGRADATSVPALSPSQLPPAGYEAKELDGTLRSYIASCETSIRIAKSLGTKVESAIETLVKGAVAGSPEEQAELLTRLHERLTKANLNLVKSTDELSRLRSFLAGGPDARADLTVKGEIELVGMILAAVRTMGWAVVDQNGKAIEVLAA